MGLIRVVGLVALLVGCDKGKVEPAKGSAQPPPAPLPVPDPQPPPVDAMSSESIDEQLLKGIDPAPAASGVWARACNDTGKTMTALEWHDKPYKATFLEAGKCTYYEQMTHAYGYTYAKFNLKKDEFVIQPIDYMGETPLAPGLYSYHITIVDYGHRTADIRAKLDSTTTKIEVRECNDTNYDFTTSSVGEVHTVVNNGALKAHACTPYYETKRALATTSAQFLIGKDDNFYIQPADYVGARSLNPGKWSYRLSITDGRDHDARIIVEQDPW